jgi:threonine dehydratase
MISRNDISAAHTRILAHVRRTSVIEMAGDDLGLPHPVTLKLELQQHTGSFKARGAFNNLLSREVPQAGVVAASGGNHGAAVGYAAACLGIPARIFVPSIAGKAKIALVQSTGATLEVIEGHYGQAAAAAEACREAIGAMSIHPFDAPETLAGQGTMAAELEQQVPDLDILLVAVGGGGLIGGIASWYAANMNSGRIRVVAVEPESAATLATALREGPETEIQPGGIAANSLGAPRIGRLAYDISRKLGIETVIVSDEAITETQRLLWSTARILAEPGGAAALAALTSGRFITPPGARVGVVVCGGNIDPSPV